MSSEPRKSEPVRRLPVPAARPQNWGRRGGPQGLATWIYLLAWLAVLVGGLVLAVGASDGGGEELWRALFVNFLFWTSLAQGAVMWAVIFRIARASWAAPISRLGHAFAWYLPFSLLVFAMLYPGRDFAPWTPSHVGDRAAWLNPSFVFLRDGAGLLVLTILSWVFVRTYLRADAAPAPPSDDQARRADATLRSSEATSLRSTSRRLSVLGVALCFAYGIIYSLLGFDLVMSLTPGWHSALLGWYFALGGLYSGIAALIVTAVLLRRWLGVSDLVGRNQFRDLGNLLMAFAMAMTYFFYSQALPIWYENLPSETVFAIPRIHLQPWQTLSWVMVGTGYLGVFVLLLVREMKERATTLAGVALLAVAAMWLERYLLVTPSLAPRAVGFPVLELLIGAGFLGVLVLVLLIFLGRHPAPSPLDLALIEDREAWR